MENGETFDEDCGCDSVETQETTNSPPWGSIKKNKENFPNKSQFIIQRGDKREDWKLPYKVKTGKIHCGGVAAASQAAGGARQKKPMSLTSAERRRLNSARRACGIENTSQHMSDEINVHLSTGHAGRFETVEDTPDKRTMTFELMDNGKLYNGVRFTKESLQFQVDKFNEKQFKVSHGMDHSGKTLDQLGPVVSMKLVEDNGVTRVFITSEHFKETDNQQQASILFAQGQLDYISGGWRARVIHNEDTNEFEIHKPTLREVSSTPIPAKTDAKQIENVCASLYSEILLDETPMEVLEMVNENPEPQEPSEEGAEEQSVKDTALIEKRQETLEQKFADLEARTISQERTALLQRAADLGLAEDDFKDVSNETFEKALEVANKVKMSTLRASDPDIVLGGEDQQMADGSPEMVDFLCKNIYRTDLMEV